jgi:hypothetical protein
VTDFMPVFQSGDGVAKEGVFAVRLERQGTLYGGRITFEGLTVAQFHVRLSEPAQVSLSKDWKPVGLWVGDDFCFDAPGGAATLELGGVRAPLLYFTVVRLP